MLTPALIYNIIILNSKAVCGKESTGLSLMAQLLVKLLMVWQVIRGKYVFCHSKLFDIYIYIYIPLSLICIEQCIYDLCLKTVLL